MLKNLDSITKKEKAEPMTIFASLMDPAAVTIARYASILNTNIKLTFAEETVIWKT